MAPTSPTNQLRAASPSSEDSVLSATQHIPPLYENQNVQFHTPLFTSLSYINPFLASSPIHSTPILILSSKPLPS